jgi:CBS domain containing-hemolysin-like protein
MWFFFLLAIVLSFLLSGLETAVLSVSRVRVRHAADARDKKARELLPLLDDREGMLGALTIANHLANVAAFGYLLWLLVRTWGDPGYLVGFLLALPLFIIGLEVLPKNLFRRYPFRALVRFLPLLRLASLFKGLFRGIPTPPGLTEEGADAALRAREDLARMLNEMERAEQLPKSAARIAKRLLSTRPLTAREVMIPLDRVACLDAEASATEAAQLAREKDFSYLLVTEGADKRVLGVLPAATLPAVVPGDRQVRQHTRPTEHVDASMPTLSVLQRLRRKGQNQALVTEGPDQKPIGLITEDDIVGPLLRAE